MFYQYTKEPLQRPHKRPVYHDRLMLPAVFSNIRQGEFFREVKINLDCGTLPGTIQYILYLDVYLRAIENSFTRVYLIRETFYFKGIPQCIRSLFPVINCSHIYLSTRTEI